MVGDDRKIQVTVHGPVKRHLSQDRETFELSLNDHRSVKDLIKKLDLPEKEVWKVSINGELVEWDYPLSAGDQIFIMSPVAGG